MVRFDPSKIRMAQVAPENPQLQAWFQAAKARWNATTFAVNDPKQWLGFYYDDELLTAYGGYIGLDGTVMVTAAVCEPTKRGLTALPLLGIMLKGLTKTRRVVFMVDIANRRMQLLADRLLGARTIALVKEL